jgi:hypothetical protein
VAVFAFLTPGYWLYLGPAITYGPGRRIRCCRAGGSFWGCGFSHDFGRIFCAKGKLLPIESKLSHLSDFRQRFQLLKPKKGSHRGLLRKIRGYCRSQLY